MARRGLVLRDVELDGRRGLDVRLEGGRIAEIGPRLAPAKSEIHAKGGALIPGLIDHHIHLLGLAAQADSVVLDATKTLADFADAIRSGASGRPAGAWVRATGYHERFAGELTRERLDEICPGRPVRVQHQTGALWVLNSLGLAVVLRGEPPPSFVETDAAGEPTGRIWRGDAWLSERIGRTLPPLAPIGRRMAAFGVTGLTDATATTDVGAAERLAEAHRRGDLPQRLMLMSRGELEAPPDGAFAVGSVKIMLDERDLPPLEAMGEAIASARVWGRTVAVHCVTAAELAFTLAAFEAFGSRAGDRIEHGGVIPAGAIGVIADLKLRVVTQPGFILERGDRYLADVPAEEHDDLYRCASLAAAGIPVAASSDAPYGPPDPWLALRTAQERRTRGGAAVGLSERLEGAAALRLFLGDFSDPGGPARRIEPGARADLCLLKAPLDEALRDPDASLVAATLVAGGVTCDNL
jgi:predicted amidohydrolase YtcJ